MDIYKEYHNDDILKILDAINDKYRDYDVMCHGRYHALFVADTAEYILKSLAYDARTIELGKIAGLLHDIGCIVGRRKHASMSAAIVSVWLEDSVVLLPEEKNVIIQAIKEHSGDKEISSAVGAAILFADKIDYSKKRNLTPEPNHRRYKYLSTIDDVEVNISSKAITVNYITNDIFSIDKNKQPYNLLIAAAQYFGCTCHFQINGKEVSFG